MSFGRLVAQTGVMILTGKVVNEAFEKGKQKYAELKAKREGKGETEPKQVDSVTQIDDDEAS